MTTEQLIPLIVMAVVLPLVLLRNRRPRTLRPRWMWVVPAIVVVMIGFGLWATIYFDPDHTPFGPVDFALLVAGLALGVAAGWQRGRMVVIHKDPDGVLKAQASPLGLILIVALLAGRQGLRALLEPHAARMGPQRSRRPGRLHAPCRRPRRRPACRDVHPSPPHPRGRAGQPCGDRPMRRLARLLAGLMTAGLAGPLCAQEATTWDLQAEGPDRLVASVLFGNGPGLAVQCAGGVFDFALLNLPPAPRDGDSHRKLETGLDLADLDDDYWQAQAGSSTALAFTAARRARALRAGGVYHVKVPGTDGRQPLTFALPLPEDSAGVDRVLEACGKPVVEPRDDLPEVEHLLVPGRWAFRGFELIPPERAVRAGRGMTRAEVSCLIAPAGRVHDCRIESETPHDMGVGEALLRSADRVRLNFGDNAEAAVGGVLYTTVTSFRR